MFIFVDVVESLCVCARFSVPKYQQFLFITQHTAHTEKEKKERDNVNLWKFLLSHGILFTFFFHYIIRSFVRLMKQTQKYTQKYAHFLIAFVFYCRLVVRCYMGMMLYYILSLCVFRFSSIAFASDHSNSRRESLCANTRLTRSI